MQWILVAFREIKFVGESTHCVVHTVTTTVPTCERWSEDYVSHTGGNSYNMDPIEKLCSRLPASFCRRFALPAIFFNSPNLAFLANGSVHKTQMDIMTETSLEIGTNCANCAISCME